MNGYHEYKDIIELCLRCAATCEHCASSCTKEKDIKMMAGCIQADMECAVLCYATAQLMSLGSSHSTRLCVICADACETCANECAKHDTDHCRECTAICLKCVEACRKMNNR